MPSACGASESQPDHNKGTSVPFFITTMNIDIDLENRIIRVPSPAVPIQALHQAVKPHLGAGRKWDVYLLNTCIASFTYQSLVADGQLVLPADAKEIDETA
jgi:hypothetical protein